MSDRQQLNEAADQVIRAFLTQLHQYLNGLREKLARLGAKRIAIDGSWYWDLQPDYRWGDVIER